MASTFHLAAPRARRHVHAGISGEKKAEFESFAVNFLLSFLQLLPATALRSLPQMDGVYINSRPALFDVSLWRDRLQAFE